MAVEEDCVRGLRAALHCPYPDPGKLVRIAPSENFPPLRFVLPCYSVGRHLTKTILVSYLCKGPFPSSGRTASSFFNSTFSYQGLYARSTD